MLKNISGLLLFEEQRNYVSNYRILAQKYIDNGVHPRSFNKGKLKNEIALEYNRRILIDISEQIKMLTPNKLKRLKHFLNLRTNKNKSILESIKTADYKKLDKIHNFLLQLSKSNDSLVIPKSNTKKIYMKMGPKKGTRKKSKKRLK